MNNNSILTSNFYPKYKYDVYTNTYYTVENEDSIIHTNELSTLTSNNNSNIKYINKSNIPDIKDIRYFNNDRVCVVTFSDNTQTRVNLSIKEIPNFDIKDMLFSMCIAKRICFDNNTKRSIFNKITDKALKNYNRKIKIEHKIKIENEIKEKARLNRHNKKIAKRKRKLLEELNSYISKNNT